MAQKDTRLKYACYTANMTISVVGNLSPILFMTFRSLYGISYSLLGFLVLINFSTQLATDLIVSFLSQKFNMTKLVKNTPVFAIVGFLIYAMWPYVFQEHIYWGLVVGTVIFSISSGLADVLMSPVITAISEKNTEREMSKLHSAYAWGVVGVVIFSTLFLYLFGKENWQILGLLFVIIPLISAVLFRTSKIPELQTSERVTDTMSMLKNKTLWLCIIAIFVGGASECSMSQWCSGYLEQALNIPKVQVDIFGVALFATMLGFGRSLYAKIGKNIERVLFWSVIGATLCYLVAAISNIALIGLLACGFTGFCVSMLWTGCLLVAANRIPTGGVFIYAMMAAGGDLGASIGPQMVGVITDFAMKSNYILQLTNKYEYTVEQLGMKCGMLTGMIFPFAGIFIFLHILKTKPKIQGEVGHE